MFPEYAEELDKESSSNENADYSRYGAGTTLDDGLTSQQDDEGFTDDAVTIPMVNVTSLWYKDYTQVPIVTKASQDQLKQDGRIRQRPDGLWVYSDTGELWNEFNAPEMTTQQPLFPYGRYTVFTDNVRLVDIPWGFNADTGAMPSPIDAKQQTGGARSWPIAICQNIVLPGVWYGMDETEQLKERQDILNDMASAMQDHCESSIHPKCKYGVNAVLNPKKINNSPDAMIPMEDGRFGELEWVVPKSLGPDARWLADFSDRSMEQSGGIPGTNMARTLDREATATEIATLDRAGRGRVGMSSALLDEYITRIYMLMGECIQENYDLNRLVRIMGDDGMVTAMEMAAGHKAVAFDVMVEPASTLPQDKDKRKAELLQLNQIMSTPSPLLPEILDAFEMANKQQLLQRAQSWQMFMQYLPVLQDPNFQMLAQQYMQQQQAAPPQQEGR